MKILMLMRFLNFSGASKMFLWVAKALSTAGNDVTIYIFSNNITYKPEKGISFIHEDLSSKGIIGKMYAIRNIVKKVNADVSISFLLDANVYNTFACIGQKTKSLICERNDPFKPRYYKLKFWKPFFRLANGGVFQLDKVAKYYSNIKGEIAVIPNPITVTPQVTLKPFKERNKQIVTVGRIAIEQKRNDLQIEAFELFHKRHPDYKLIIYGRSINGDDIKLQKLIKEKGLTDNVIMPGVINDVQETIKDSQIYLLTSDYEGIPNSLLEAMSIGLPCLSTDCRPGGASFLIKDGFNGLLAPCGNPQILAEKLCWFAEHPHEADIMGEKAKNIAKTLSEEKIKDLWIEYLNKLTTQSNDINPQR